MWAFLERAHILRKTIKSKKRMHVVQCETYKSEKSHRNFLPSASAESIYEVCIQKTQRACTNRVSSQANQFHCSTELILVLIRHCSLLFYSLCNLKSAAAVEPPESRSSQLKKVVRCVMINNLLWHCWWSWLQKWKFYHKLINFHSLPFFVISILCVAYNSCVLWNTLARRDETANACLEQSVRP